MLAGNVMARGRMRHAALFQSDIFHTAATSFKVATSYRYQ